MSTENSPLGDRKQRILKAIVHEHVETAEPVGSEMLVVHYDFGVRSATIRNEMAEMAEMGYLRQPHTSAGRVPSDMGYRFYVDRLMGATVLPTQDTARAKETLASVAAVVDHAITQTCRILSSLTHYTSIATQPYNEDTVIRHINLSRVAGGKLLMVVVLSDGRVEHRIMSQGTPVSDAEITRVSNALVGRFAEKAIDSLILVDGPDVEPINSLWDDALTALRKVIESLSPSQGNVWVEGTGHILRQPEFKEPEKIECVMALLEERKQLYQLLSRVILGPEVSIVIGSENPYEEMQSTSFVAAKYKIGDRVAGTIGVVGPTRMDYGRAVSAVEVMARNLGELLTNLSLT